MTDLQRTLDRCSICTELAEDVERLKDDNKKLRAVLKLLVRHRATLRRAYTAYRTGSPEDVAQSRREMRALQAAGDPVAVEFWTVFGVDGMYAAIAVLDAALNGKG